MSSPQVFDSDSFMEKQATQPQLEAQFSGPCWRLVHFAVFPRYSGLFVSRNSHAIEAIWSFIFFRTCYAIFNCQLHSQR